MKRVLILFILITSIGYSQEKNIFDIARNGTIDEIISLHKSNPNLINTVNENQSSPLILACYRGNFDVAVFLINNVADINYNSGMGTALMAAVVKGNSKLVNELLHENAKINLTDTQGTTALMYAVQFQNIAITKMLLDQKADKTIKNKDGKTAFEFAIFTNNEKLINLLK